MKKKIRIVSILLFVCILCNAQKEGHTWMIGYVTNTPDTVRSTMSLDFNVSPPVINQILKVTD